MLLINYADDAQFIHTGDVNDLGTLIMRAENTLNKAQRYFDENGLLINAGKTQCIFIGSRQNIAKLPANITINFNGT